MRSEHPGEAGGGRRSRPGDAPPGAGSRVVVIGLGNPLLADDGIGLAALARLREEWSLSPDVELLDGGTWGMMLLPAVEDADRLLLLDAIDVGDEPGETVVLERDDLPLFLDGKISTHQVGIREVLALASLRGTLPEETVAVGLQPAELATETALSPEAVAGLDDLVVRAVDRLRSWGVGAEHRPAEEPVAGEPGRA